MGDNLIENEGMQQVHLQDIIISKKNVRTNDLYIGLDELAQSIKEIGFSNQ